MEKRERARVWQTLIIKRKKIIVTSNKINKQIIHFCDTFVITIIIKEIYIHYFFLWWYNNKKLYKNYLTVHQFHNHQKTSILKMQTLTEVLSLTNPLSAKLPLKLVSK